MELKKTPLYDRHLQSNAKIIDFSAWILPLEYESALKEARATRTTCGLFDVSHMGRIKIEGRDALIFLQKLISNDLALIKKCGLQYNLFLNKKGGIIDDFIVYNLGGSFLCVVNASNTDKVYQWLKENQKGKVEIKDENLNTSLLSLQGPKAYLIMEQIFGKSISNLQYMHFVEENLKDKKIIVSRSGYTGEDGFEIYSPSSSVSFLWDLILEKGKDFGIKLCGLGARDILRIEAGYPLYGHEIDETFTPLEASLDWAVKMNKDFMGKEELVKVKKEGAKKKRVGFVMKERAMPRQGYQIYSPEKLIGMVSSGTYSPNLNKFIGMAFIEQDFSRLETNIGIKIRDKLYQANITAFPFIEIKTKKVV